MRRSRQAKATRWSDPATWPDHQGAGGRRARSISQAARHVLTDVSPPPLNGVTVHGKLTFADKSDLELTTEWVMLHGQLEVGTEGQALHAQGHHHPH